jgi:hypothetical protein
MTSVLNGVDTYTFDYVCNSASVATRITEGATIGVALEGTVAFLGAIKSTSARNRGFIKTVVAESPLCVVRDTDIAEESARGLTKLSALMRDLLPEGFTVQYNAAQDPLVEYSFRSGSILSHLNTLCSLSGVNWRASLLTATTASIVVSDDGAYNTDTLELVENQDIFKLQIDRSLFKQYTQVTVVGVEPEVSGLVAVASLNEFKLNGVTYPATYFLLDCDDGEIGNDEVPVPGYIYEYISPLLAYNRLDLRYGADLKGWESNRMCLVNGEFIAYGYKSGQSLFNVQREQWASSALGSHVIGDPCVLVEKLYLTTPATFSPATTLFKIGDEVVKGDLNGTELTLATVDPSSYIYLGRGLEYDEYSGWVCNNENIYSHKRGSVVTPYYPDAEYLTQTASHLDITVHGKGIVTRDGLDRLAWGILRNTQNGIVSGSGTFRAGDFFDKSVAVGQKIRVVTASTTTGTMNVISPATTYDCLIYSITRKQNTLMQIEFGNVIPEVLQMLKSGQYALQAALRKTKDADSKSVDTISISGAYVTHSGDRIAKLR